MKNILFLGLLLSAVSSPAFAGKTLECTGKGWVHFAAVPFPLYKSLTVTLKLTDDSHGSVELTAGGDPISYSGPLALDGQQPVLITSQESGDLTALTLVLENEKTLKLAVQFSNAQYEKTGSISPTTLTCK